jgi:hypothetical protein
MIERMVFVRLKDEFRNDRQRAEIASYSQTTLQQIPQVREAFAATAADDKTSNEWDLVLAIRLDSPEDLEPFRLDPVHRQYVDNYLKPKLSHIKGWNFCRS